MSKDKNEELLDGLLRRAIVPAGLRPRSEQDEDAMLDAMGYVEISPQKRDRMLRKIRGEEPYALERPEPTAAEAHPNVAAELAPMFRDEGDIPPDLQRELEDLERETAEGNFDENEDSDGSES